MFGAQKQSPFGGSLFGNSGTTPAAGGGIFGSTTTQPQQTGGLFGNTTTQQSQQTGGLFGGTSQPQQQSGGLFGGLGQSQPQQQSGGLFGGLGQSQTQQPQTGGLFGQTAQPQQQSTGLFGNTLPQQQASTGLFGQSAAQQPQQPQGGLFGQSNQQQRSLFLNTAQSSLLQSQGGPSYLENNGLRRRDNTVPDQIKSVLEKWDVNNPNCVFKYYFYNKAGDNAPFFHPGENENKDEWEEALSKKPGPGYVPSLCVGFGQMSSRIISQQEVLRAYKIRLGEINNSLTALLQHHETQLSIRAMDAKRKHVVLKRRCLVLARKVQVLRNKGFAMDGDEENLKAKLVALDKGASDPGLGARAEEIWARMITVQERARLLKAEIEKSGSDQPQILDEDTDARAKKILEDYQTQLVHLKNELDKIQKEYTEWEKEQPIGHNNVRR